MAPIDSLPIRLTQTLGLTTSLLLGGSTITLSTFLIPRLLESPSPLLLKQWLHTFTLGKRTNPPIAILSSLSYLYLSYSSHLADPTDNRAWVYLSSGVLMLGIVPYTFAFMSGVNNKLGQRAEDTATLGAMDEVVEVGLGGETAHQLVDWWGMLNLGRGVMMSVAGILGVWTALN